MRFHRAALALVSLSFLSSSLFAGSINLVANPDFATNMNGWVTSYTPAMNFWAWDVAQTAKLAAFDAGSFNVSLTQTVSGLTPGDEYLLSFDLTVKKLALAYLDWSFGTDSGSVSVSSHPSITVTATSASELLSFSGNVLSGSLVLDNVSVVAAAPPPRLPSAGGNSSGAPEPATWILMGSLVAIASRARRTRFGQISS